MVIQQAGTLGSLVVTTGGRHGAQNSEYRKPDGMSDVTSALG